MLFLVRKTTHLWLKLPRHLSISATTRQAETIFNEEIKIGNVSKAIFPPKNFHLVPIQYISKEPSKSVIRHLQWILKKDVLGQDIFFIGLPGPMRGQLILQYLEMMQREVEYVVLTRDTTENDLKQRREIYNGSAHYVDQSAVRAAIEGRFLILDGIEKVERNVLPVMNNLLENREMQLEDGRFLIAPERYDKLLLDHTQEELDRWKLVRVSENFRVVALGLPVPHFKGNPLDPPFRSRFQARHITLNFEEHLLEVSKQVRTLSTDNLKDFLSSCYTFLSNESTNLGLPKFPIENVSNAIKVWDKIPILPSQHVFRWVYPYNLLLSKDGQNSVLKTLEQFSIKALKFKPEYKIALNSDDHADNSHVLEIKVNRNKFVTSVLGHRNYKTYSNFISNSYHESILADLLMTHTSHDFCIIGNKGSGKATIVKKFASLLNYPIEMVMLYNDMTARDLLQQRITDESGNTLWRLSQLVQAAKGGKLLVLDGLQRLHSSTYSVLQRLIHNRDMQLYDGTRLLRHDRYDSLKEKLKLSEKEMDERKIIRIDPAFRIAALAEPPKLQSKKDNWMSPELLSMFLFHTVRPLSLKEEKIVIQNMVENISTQIDPILEFTHKLRNSEDDALRNVSGSFSTRQLVRIARRLSTFPEESIYNLITQSCLMKFLPPLTKQAVENVLESCSLKELNESSIEKEIFLNDEQLKIGNTSAPVYKPNSNKAKIPNIIFYDSQEHVSVMEAMLQNFLLGEHLLLVGNQGVGKNKITDRFLQLLNRPREYIQLHRDTTVQSLTQQPTVVDGRIMYEDSPLLRAVQHGHVLVVDEADKAPTHVTSILKALVVSGEMNLSDGRCIVHHTDANSRPDSEVVVMHPDFRMIVLANRPGFPFLGNDFFATLGDIFSCHAVDNPSLHSEVSMLRQYGPNVPEYLLKKLASLFGDLRSMSDAGLISYPYSTREVVNVIKHLDKFPDEGVQFVLKNVFDFDSYSQELKETLNDVFRKYGVPLESQAFSVKLANKYKLPEPLKSEWKFDNVSEFWPFETYPLHFMNESKMPIKKEVLNIVDTRAGIFSEQQNYCQLLLNHNDIPLDITSTNLKDITYIATANPISIFTMDYDKMKLYNLNLSSYFPTVRSGFRPVIKIMPVDFIDENFLLLQESTTNQSFLVQPTSGYVSKINLSSFFEETFSKISHVVYSGSANQNYQLCDNFQADKKAVLFDKNTSKVIVLNFADNKMYHIESPHQIKSVCILDTNSLLLIGTEDAFVADISNPEKWKIRKFADIDFEISSDINIQPLQHKTHSGLIDNAKPQALMSNLDNYACLVSGSFSIDNALKVSSFPRKELATSESRKSCIFPLSSQLVKFLQYKELESHVKADIDRAGSGYLEVVDVKDNSYSYIQVDLPHVVSSFASWLANTSNPYLLMCPSTNGKLITADASGCIRKWEINKHSLEGSFEVWKNFAGLENDQQLTIEYVNKKSVSAPKHGKLDPSGSPHVGGNTWAGGTGGRDTAGLGGKGGPYRLDAGHNVFQISDQEKENVPPEVREAARLMAMKAYQQKLKEIEMSEYDAKLYNQFYASVEKQVKTLRVILDGLQAKGKDRQWLKHQTSGEFDDSKLIEGITGEKSIYKRRGEQEPEMGSPQEKPKLLRLVVDVSGSMYRFNGYDNRLDRELECAVLVMEAFDGYHERFQYEIIGHSGEDFHIEFSKFNKPPKNPKERLDLIRNMHAHSQFCASGDNTLEATDYAIKTLVNEESDEHFVIVMSDANFDRYGISPVAFGKLLTSDPKVNAFAIFIGSLGDQAVMLSNRLPAGRTFMCFDSSNLSQILQKIFTSALLKD